jgi:catechol 2,3-dioxygenase-like lactoylglutathione lyase family enzyme
MTIGYGAPPKTGWATLVCELLVEDVETSLAFWRDVMGFAIAYQRPEEGFVYLERPDGAQIMLCRRSGKWETGKLERPYGRGVMFQLYVDDLAETMSALSSADWPIYAGPREVWRRHGDREGGQREIFVQDPDGYLIMIAENIGERPLSTFGRSREGS